MTVFRLTLGSRTGLVAAAALLLTACAPAQDAPTPTIGVDVSHYLAVGDSYTAGFSAGGLTRTGQEYSFPNLLAQQLRGATAGAAFTQPLLDAGTGSGYLELVDFTAAGFPRARRVAGTAVRSTVVNPGACGGTDTVRLLLRSATAGNLPQNLGVPGLPLSQIETLGLGNDARATAGAGFNPYFERLLPAATNTTYLQAVATAAASATFFTFFQGLDDLMPYVRSGGQCGAAPTAAFANQMKLNAKKILDVLTAGGRQGIIAKLPAITSLPLLRLGKGDKLETRLQAQFGDTANVYIESPFNPSQAQRISDKDYVLATALAHVGQLTPVVVNGTTRMLPYGRDSRNPLRDADVLDAQSELNLVNSAISNYNNSDGTVANVPLGLNALAQLYKLPVIDASQGFRTLDVDVSLFNQVANVISVGGVQYSAEPVRGNFFSLDYYTLTPRGNGLLANAFITAINKAYRSNIPAVDVNSLPTTK